MNDNKSNIEVKLVALADEWHCLSELARVRDGDGLYSGVIEQGKILRKCADRLREIINENHS